MRLGVDVLASSARSAKMRWPFCAEVPIESTLGLGSRTRGHWFLHAFHVATILGAMILDGCTRRRTVELNVVGLTCTHEEDARSRVTKYNVGWVLPFFVWQLEPRRK